MQFIKLTEKQAVPIEQIQYIKAASLSTEDLYGYKSEVTVLRPDGCIGEYYSTKTISELVDEINRRS